MESMWLKIVKALTILCATGLCVASVFLVFDAGRPPPSPDQMRAVTAKRLMEALEKYRSAVACSAPGVSSLHPAPLAIYKHRPAVSLPAEAR